ncbi:hypothetical protein AAFF_G00068210 [Aldrovandia affinis]|uniref:Uncharacterized protein n=1 Tax=Aldrovandia affinis TaxID=143900 RepID=A0AAD7RZL3_9TELE|nr:hypothetical protein AAFF_G00068210 [Aldrovandia affinis]
MNQDSTGRGCSSALSSASRASTEFAESMKSSERSSGKCDRVCISRHGSEAQRHPGLPLQREQEQAVPLERGQAVSLTISTGVGAVSGTEHYPYMVTSSRE